MKTFTSMCLSALLGALVMAPAQASIYKDPGYVEQAARVVTKNKAIGRTHQYRGQQGWMFVDSVANGATSGFYQGSNWLKLHNRNFKLAVGFVEFSFNPSKLDCTQGMSFNLEIGEDTVAEFKPNCDD